MTTTIHPHHLCLHNFSRINRDDGVPLCEPWDSLLTRAEELHGEGDFDGAIETVAAVYDKLVRHQIRALELKSRFQLNKRNYTLAFQDAVDVVHMAPLMALGYLLKVDIYLAQNQPIEALGVCRNALQTIPKVSSGDAYRAITAKMAEVEGAFVDFTVKLPVEVLPLIFRNLTQYDLLTECMLVSKAWRYRLTHCASLWEVIRPDVALEERGLHPAAHLQVAPYVRRCYMVPDQHPLAFKGWTSVIYQAMKSGMFSNIRELEMVATNQIFLKPGELQTVILAGLEGVGKTLKMLKITVDFQLSIAQIQWFCPNLCALAYTNDTVVPEGGVQNMLSSTNMHSLSVTIYANNFDIQKDDIESISSSCPNLRRLHIDYSDVPDLSLFDEHCPFLESLCFNTNRDWYFWDEPTTMGSCRPTPLGLGSLSIHPRSIQTLMHYLEQHQDTLETFHLDLTYGIPGFQPHNVLQNLNFKRLRRLTFTAPRPERATVILDTILQGCVYSLEELVINDFIAIEMSTYQIMANLPSLRTICIHGLGNPEGLAEYFKTVFSTQQQHHSLKEVRLEEAKITDGVLESLAQLQKLQSVTIHNDVISETYTNEGLNWFFGNHALHSSLRNITLSSYEADQITYKLISKIPSLETLTVPHRTLLKHRKVDFLQFMDDRPDVTVSFPPGQQMDNGSEDTDFVQNV